MIAILHKDNIIALFISDVISINGGTITGQTGSAKGVTHDVLVVDGYTYGVETIPATYETQTRTEIDPLTVEEIEAPYEVLLTPERERPYIEMDGARLYVGDEIDPGDFDDQSALVMAGESDAEKIARLETENNDLKGRVSDMELAFADIITGGGV